VSSHGRPVKAEEALIFPFVSDRRSASPHPRGKSAMRIAIYRWCLDHHVGRIRGGHRLLRVLHRLTPALSSYPIRLDDGLAPVYIDLTRATWQEVQLFTAPTVHEAPLQALFRALITPKDRVVDIGANLGRHMVLLDHLAAHVDAVEPNSALLPNLRRTVAGLQHTTLHECALGDHTGSVSMIVPADHSTAHVGGAGSTPLRRLDDLVHGPIDLMKVDVEGFEAPVFRGAARLLNHAAAPVIVFEELHRNSEARDVLASYQAARYRFWVIPREGPIQPYDDDRPKWCDVLAVPAARHATVALRLGLQSEPVAVPQ